MEFKFILNKTGNINFRERILHNNDFYQKEEVKILEVIKSNTEEINKSMSYEEVISDIFKIFNSSKNIRVMNLSTRSKENFKKYIEYKKNVNIPFAFISENKNTSLTNKTGVVIFANLTLEYLNENEEPRLFFDIRRIGALDFNNNTQHGINISSDKFKLMETSFPTLSEYEEDSLKKISSIKKEVNFFDENGMIKGKEWSDFIKFFIKYLNDKKEEKKEIVSYKGKKYIVKSTEIAEGSFSGWTLVNEEDQGIKDVFDIKIEKDLELSVTIVNEINILKKEITELEKETLEHNFKIRDLETRKHKLTEVIFNAKEKLESFLSSTKLKIKKKKLLNEQLKELEYSFEKEKNVDVSDKIKKINEYVKSIEDIEEADNLKAKNFKKELSITEKNSLLFVSRIKEIKSKVQTINIKKKNINSRVEILVKNSNFLIDKNIYLIELTQNRNTNFPEYSEIQETPDFQITKWTINDFDAGLFAKFKRYSSAIQDINEGIYKNPTLMLSIENGDLIEKNKNIKTEIDLNDKQLEAARKSISSPDISYIQGPPGTGKTQTISAIADHLIEVGERVMITSSTHEAIDNFFDRLHLNSKTNPNVFMYRQIPTTNKKRENNYPVEKLYVNFISRIDAQHTMRDDSKLQKSLEKAKLINENIKSSTLFEKLIEYISEMNEEIFKKFIEENGNLIEKSFHGVDLPYEFVTKQRVKNAFSNDKENKVSNSSENHDIINHFYEEASKTMGIVKLLEIDINKFVIKPNEKTNIEKAFEDLSEINESNANYSIEKTEFENKVISNKKINVIGITTTSKKQVNLKGKSFRLFDQLPINSVIIDEISKSITPEILTISRLADKSIYVGDYKQLPPNMDLEENIIEEFINHPEGAKWATEYGLSTNKEAAKFLSELYSNSFFAGQVKKLKTENKPGTPYTFLNIQHRFTEQIMQLVNVYYDYEEKLKMPNKKREFNAFPVYINGEKNNSELIGIDTSHITNDYIKFLNNELVDIKFKQGDGSFDQEHSILTREKRHSRINNFNAFVVVQLAKDLILNGAKPKNIGIIAMTRSQVSEIKQTFKRIKFDLNDIKIDTVDNFQGREKEIIITDFVRAKNKLLLNKNNFFVNEEIKRNLDFYKSYERINVAVSRAKSKLILVGAFENHLSKDSDALRNYWSEIKDLELSRKWK